VAKPELGSKRQCLSCGAKFYDLHKDPIVCPKCGAVFQAAALKTRPEAVVARPADDEVDADAGAVELVSLDDVEAAEEGKEAAVAAGDVEIEDDAEADDTFLAEEEEGDDDVADLIDGDIEDDEEA
jgi:uncharacterized protein (TIGR02300 family)